MPQWRGNVMRGAAGVLALILLAGPVRAQLGPPAESLTSSVRSALAVLDAAGKPVRNATPGLAGVLRLTLTDAATGAPGRLEGTRAFIRVLDGEAAECASRVRIFRATGAVTALDHSLQGTLILSLSADSRLSLVDPQRPDARNTLAIRALPEGRFRLVHDATRARYYLQDGAGGTVYRIRMPDLALQPIDEAANGHLHLDGGGPVILAGEGAFRLGADGRARAVPWPSGPWTVALPGRVPILADSSGHILVVPATRAERARPVAAPKKARPLAASADGAVLVMAEGEKIVVIATATGARDDVAIGRSAKAAWFASDERHLLVLHDDDRTLAVVDTATPRLVQAVSLERRLVDLAFIGAIGFIQTEDSSVFRFPVASLTEGRALELTPATAMTAATREVNPPSLPKLSGMADGSGVLAAGTGAGRIARLMIDDHPALNGAPPPTAPTAIRTGRVLAMASVERGFTEQAPGVYEASFLPRAAGDHLLVVADAQGRFSACHRIRVGDDDPIGDRERKARLVLDRERSTLGGAGPSRVVFHVDSELAHLSPREAPIEIMDIGSHWRGRAVAGRQQDGSFAVEIRFPRPGNYIIQPRVSGASAAFARPLAVTVPEGVSR